MGILYDSMDFGGSQSFCGWNLTAKSASTSVGDQVEGLFRLIRLSDLPDFFSRELAGFLRVVSLQERVSSDCS